MDTAVLFVCLHMENKAMFFLRLHAGAWSWLHYGIIIYSFGKSWLVIVIFIRVLGSYDSRAQ